MKREDGRVSVRKGGWKKENMKEGKKEKRKGMVGRKEGWKGVKIEGRRKS